MSRSAPDRNVTHQRLGSGGGRARSLRVAQSPAAGRGTGRAAASLFSECALAREARRNSLQDQRDEGDGNSACLYKELRIQQVITHSFAAYIPGLNLEQLPRTHTRVPSLLQIIGDETASYADYLNQDRGANLMV
jgi:hypothetical protein